MCSVKNKACTPNFHPVHRLCNDIFYQTACLQIGFKPVDIVFQAGHAVHSAVISLTFDDKQVDTVTGATYSSSAIRAGVRKLAESYLAEGKRSEEEETGLTAEERAAVERELVQLERKVQMHRRIWESSERLLKQLRERKEEELELRFIAAVDGKEAAAEFAKEHDMMFFNHPRRGPEKKSRTELLGEAYRSSRSAEDLAKLKAAILEDYEGLLLRVPPHNEEHLKAMKASQERVELLKKKLGYADQTGSPAITE